MSPPGDPGRPPVRVSPGSHPPSRRAHRPCAPDRHHALFQVILVAVMVMVLLSISGWQVRTLRRYLVLQQEAARRNARSPGRHGGRAGPRDPNPLGRSKAWRSSWGETGSRPATVGNDPDYRPRGTRLERLVNDLLSYARPRPPDSQPTAVPGSSVSVAVGPAGRGSRGVVCRLDVPAECRPSLPTPSTEATLRESRAQRPPGHTQGWEIDVRGAFPEGTGGPRRPLRSQSRIPGRNPAADLPRVFEPFYTTRTKGTGLGLAICKQIVEAHGGGIRVARTSPEGTTILVTLPVEGPAHG